MLPGGHRRTAASPTRRKVLFGRRPRGPQLSAFGPAAMRRQPGGGAGEGRQLGRISRTTEASGTRPCTTLRRTSGRGSGAPTRQCAAQRARRGAPRKRGPHGRLPERGRERLEHREEEDSPQSGAYARTWVNPDRRVLRPECGKRQKMILFCPKAPGCRVPHYTPTGFNPQWIR